MPVSRQSKKYRRPASSRPSRSLDSSKNRSPLKSGKPRVKKASLPLSRSHRLLISFRRFRTRPQRRSARYRQTVLWFNLFSFREVAIAKVPKQSWRLYHKTSKPCRHRRPFKWAFLVPLPAALFSLGIYYPMSVNRNSVEIVSIHKALASAQTIAPKSMPTSPPEHLSIPAIDLNSSLITVGRNSDGSIETPGNPGLPGWYKYGPTPGEIGPAVIVGHLDSPTDIAVFWRLRELKPSDEIIISRQDGTSAKFSVTHTLQFSRDHFPTKEIYGNINYAGIRLITCGGTFNYQTRQYDQNTVVFGKLE